MTISAQFIKAYQHGLMQTFTNVDVNLFVDTLAHLALAEGVDTRAVIHVHHEALGALLHTMPAPLPELTAPAEMLAQVLALMEQEAEAIRVSFGTATQELHALYQLQQFLVGFLEHTTSYVYFKNTQGVHQFVSHSLTDLFNLPLSEIIDKSDRELHGDEIGAVLESHDRRVIESRISQQFNETLIINGEERHYISVKFPIFDQNDQIIGIGGVSTDITRWLITLRELETNELLYRALFEQSHDGVFIFDLDGKYIKVNQQAADMLGYPLDELEGKHAYEVMPEIEYDDALRRRDILLSGEALPVYERQFIRKDGSFIFAEISVSLVKDSEGNPIHVQSVVHDITERKRLEETLRLNTRVIEASPVAISIADVRQPDYPLIYVNLAFERMTGYTAEEAIGKNCRFLYGDDHDQTGLDTMHSAVSKHESCSIVLRNHTKDGRLLWVDLRLSPIFDPRGELIYYVGIQTNITQQREAEEQIQQSLQHQRELNELKSLFVSMTSHEFRTPLSIIRSAGETLRDHIDKMTPEQRQRKFKTIDEQVLRLIRLLDDVLMYSKNENHHQNAHFEDFNITEWLAEWLELFQSAHMSHAIDYTYLVPDDDGDLIVYADKIVLDQVLTNLLSNAIKYSPNASNVELEVSLNTPDLYITVRDYGIGIPQADQQKLFERFWRGSNVGKIPGTGLGLMILKQSVALFNGEIAFESSVEHGSTFRVRLPIVRQQNVSEFGN